MAIGVQDQGIGISESKKASLFVRFENLLDKNLFNQQSSGIGLSWLRNWWNCTKRLSVWIVKRGRAAVSRLSFER